jgi:thymidylate synthase ThyX
MEVKLAGINVPIGILSKLPESEKVRATPEVISAAYARISRSTKSVDELIMESIENVQKARESNEAIIYGMGHHSIADHVIFNLNIKGVSRLLIESIEKRRLAGYTEKSQRYVTLDGDYVRPKEFSPKDLGKFEKLITLQNEFYFKVNQRLLDHLKKKFPDNGEKFLESKAKEDARFSLSLATEAQLGCSYTGQTAELAIRELKYGGLQEEREFAKLLYNTIVKKAPSIIQLTDPELFSQHNPGQEFKDDNFKFTKSNLESLVKKTFADNQEFIDHYGVGLGDNFSYYDKVTLVNSNDIDLNILTAILHKNSKRDIRECYAISTLLIERGSAQAFIKEALKHISEHDKVPREFETSGLIYEVVISASGFAQLKRHRMNTLLSQDYNPDIGYTIPQSIEEIGASRGLKGVCDKSSELYKKFLSKYGRAAEYCLTNAHRRRVIVATNMRQLYHISRTREDEHAQWEIRNIANKMSKLAKNIAPATTILLGGKHEFNEIKGVV